MEMELGMVDISAGLETELKRIDMVPEMVDFRRDGDGVL